jgi:hypothetical protein
MREDRQVYMKFHIEHGMKLLVHEINVVHQNRKLGTSEDPIGEWLRLFDHALLHNTWNSLQFSGWSKLDETQQLQAVAAATEAGGVEVSGGVEWSSISTLHRTLSTEHLPWNHFTC